MTSPVIITKDPVEVNFIQRIQNTFGLDPEQIVDVNDPLTKLTLAIAITTIEQGENNYSYDQYVKGIAKSSGIDAADLDEQLNVTSLPFENNTGSAGFVSPATNLISSGRSSVGSGARLDVGAYISITSTPVVPVTMAEIGGIGNYIQRGVNTVTGYFGGGTANQNNSTTIIPGNTNSNSEAQYVLLSTGTNSWGSNPAAVQNQINSTIQSLTDKGYNPGNIVMLLPPRTVNGTSTAYDAALAAAREKGIATINVPSDTADGLHYTVAGNQRVLQAFSEATGQSTEALKGNTLVIGDSRAVLANRALNSNPDLAVQGLSAEQILNRTQSVPTATTTIIPGTPGSGDIAVRDLPPPVSTNPDGSQSATPSQNANIINQAPSPAAVGLPEGSTVTPLYQVNSSGPTQLLQVTYKSPDGNTRILDARTGVVKSENGEVLGTAREVPLDQTNLRTQIESGGSPSGSAVLFTPAGQQENTAQQQTLTATYTAPGGESFSVTSNVTSTASQQLQPLVDRNSLISTEITSLREQNTALKSEISDLDQRIQAAQAAGEPVRPLLIQQAQTQLQIVNNQERIVNLGAEKQAIDAKLENPSQPVGEQSAIFNDRINELQAKIDNPEGIPAGEYLQLRQEYNDLKATQTLLEKPYTGSSSSIDRPIDEAQVGTVRPIVGPDYVPTDLKVDKIYGIYPDMDYKAGTNYNPYTGVLSQNDAARYGERTGPIVTPDGTRQLTAEETNTYKARLADIEARQNAFQQQAEEQNLSPSQYLERNQAFNEEKSLLMQEARASQTSLDTGSIFVAQSSPNTVQVPITDAMGNFTGFYESVEKPAASNPIPNPAGPQVDPPLITEGKFDNRVLPYQSGGGTTEQPFGPSGQVNQDFYGTQPVTAYGPNGEAIQQSSQYTSSDTSPLAFNAPSGNYSYGNTQMGTFGPTGFQTVDNTGQVTNVAPSTPFANNTTAAPSSNPAGGAASPAAPGGATASAAQQQGMAKGC